MRAKIKKKSLYSTVELQTSMVDFYLIAYYTIDTELYFSVLEDGKRGVRNECTGTGINDLATRVQFERDVINSDIPVGLINMVPHHEKNSNAHRLSRIHEKSLMQTLFGR